jgi:hypothetical protein
MSVPKTMFQLSGRGYAAANLSHATVVIIDAQKEYLSGPLALSGMDAAVANIKQLVAPPAQPAGRSCMCATSAPWVACSTRRANAANSSPAWSHRRRNHHRQTAAERVPRHRTARPFAESWLAGPDRLRFHEPLQRQHHRTRREEPGLPLHLVEDACATRDLPFKGRVLSAVHVQEAEMAIMADNFATLALTQDLI